MTEPKVKKAPLKLKSPPNQLIVDTAAMMYYEEEGAEQEFTKLTKEEQDIWFLHAVALYVVIDKMNKKVVNRGEEPEVTVQRGLNDITALSDTIRKFLEGVSTVKCPRCGGKADLKPQLFPCDELAHVIAGTKK